MPQRFEDADERARLRRKILGLGEDSIHKNYFAELQQRIQQLESSERKFALAFQANPALMAISQRADGRFIEVNQAFLKTLQLTLEETIGANSLDLGIWPDPDTRENVMRKLDSAGSIHLFEFSMHRKDGPPLEALGSMALIEVNGVSCVLFMAIDITERKQADMEREKLQAQLIQSQKMDAIGQLAGGVAHDFNNLLTIINLNAELLESEMDSPSKQLEEILLAAHRAQDLTSQLLVFGRKQQMEPRRCDLNAVVSDTGKLLKRIIGEQILLETKLHQDPAYVVVDPGQLSQVILNLAINARDAMPQGGHLLVETYVVRMDEHHVRTRHQDVPPGLYAVLAMSDTGCGMDDATLAHIFEPFFTTKAKGKGTGLGLATVYGIVKQSGGHIWVYSEVGHGTQFKIYLPLDTEAPASQDTCIPQPHRIGSERILLVEDDDTVRELIQGTLTRWGYQVIGAADPLDALQLVESHPGTVHLLITDVVMPNFNGLELAQRITQQHPETRVLFISGYTDGAVLRQGGQFQGAEFLQKPFNMRDLNNRIRLILDSAAKG